VAIKGAQQRAAPSMLERVDGVLTQPEELMTKKRSFNGARRSQFAQGPRNSEPAIYELLAAELPD
jgi:hypothetical protein